jgi:DNA-binding transcriptional regulator LsrR (DeoR family)
MVESINNEHDMAAHERAALALWLLMQAPLTTNMLAQRLGLTRHGTNYLLTNISRSVPVYYADGFWRICQTDD